LSKSGSWIDTIVNQGDRDFPLLTTDTNDPSTEDYRGTTMLNLVLSYARKHIRFSIII